MDWITTIENFVTGALGGTVSVFGLSRYLGNLWLEKQKARYSKELEGFKDGLQKEQKRMQAEIDRSVFVTRAHFDTEFRAMQEVSKQLAAVKLAFRQLNPPDANDQLNDIELKRDIAQLQTTNAAFLAKLEEWGVFLEPKLYDEFERCHIGASEELKRLKANSPFEKDKILNATYFWTAYSQACQIVRDRIKSLAVLPRT